jgi:hypothetical protein
MVRTSARILSWLARKLPVLAVIAALGLAAGACGSNGAPGAGSTATTPSSPAALATANPSSSGSSGGLFPEPPPGKRLAVVPSSAIAIAGALDCVQVAGSTWSTSSVAQCMMSIVGHRVAEVTIDMESSESAAQALTGPNALGPTAGDQIAEYYNYAETSAGGGVLVANDSLSPYVAQVIQNILGGRYVANPNAG